MVHRYLVLAAGRSCYESWCAAKGLDPDGPDVKQVTSTHHLHGYDQGDITIILVCEWQTRLTFVGLEEVARELEKYKALGVTIAKDVCD